ncbi:hypothetical protein I3760_10G110600 [Carya illinoinensis]|nr:hypothetical protein I3760_10G110600 [Carya illinoinensis]
MVKVSTYFAMSLGAFLFWESMDKLHVWIALHQDEKVLIFFSISMLFMQHVFDSNFKERPPSASSSSLSIN